jgi:hypothetical protein
VFSAVSLSIINLPNLTVNKFIDACCGWIYDPGKLIVQFSPTHQYHICMKFKQKNVIQLSSAHACVRTHKQKSVLQCWQSSSVVCMTSSQWI